MAVPDRMMNKFTFGEIMTAKTSPYEPGEEDDLGDVGTITIEMYHCAIGSRVEEPIFPDLRQSNLPVISEKALTKKRTLHGKEGLGHAVELADTEAHGAEYATLPPVVRTEKVDDETYKVEFRYRSVDAVEAKLRNSDVFNLGPDALMDWQKQLREVARIGQLKRDGTTKRE